jgi:hypothetical protein
MVILIQFPDPDPQHCNELHLDAVGLMLVASSVVDTDPHCFISPGSGSSTKIDQKK